MLKQFLDAVLSGISTNSLDSASSMKITNTQLLFCLSAGRGAGNTVVTFAVQKVLNSGGNCMLPAASSTAAAYLFGRGRTTKFAAKIPIPVDKASSYTIEANSQPAGKLRRIDLLILDEIMMSYQYKAVDRSC